MELTVYDDASRQLAPRLSALRPAIDAASREASRAASAELGLDQPCVLPGVDAQEHLLELHRLLVANAISVVERRSAAEWLFYVRRFTRQFAYNTRRTTEGYSRAIAEVLTLTSPNPAPADTYVFARDDEAARDIGALVAAVGPVYATHSLLRWAGKGSPIEFKAGRLPEARPSPEVAEAVELYDSRYGRGVGGLLARAGLNAPQRSPDISPDQLASTILIGVQDANSGHYFPQPFDVRAVGVLGDWSIPIELRWPQQLADVTVLLYSLLRDRRYLEGLTNPRESTFSFAGYLLDHRARVIENLTYALDELRRSEMGGLMPTSTLESSPVGIYTRLASLEGSVWPLMLGSPLRQLEGGTSAFVDVVGATHLWHAMLERPLVTGQEVNRWAGHFEDNLQALVDQTPWRPPPELRRIRRRTLLAPNGTAVTDIDAIGTRNGDLLLISGKSVPYSAAYDRGGYREVRNRSTDAVAHVIAWRQRLDELRAAPTGRNYDFSQFRRVLGVVVTPFSLYVPIGEATADAANGLPALVSAGELETWLNDGSGRRAERRGA